MVNKSVDILEFNILSLTTKIYFEGIVSNHISWHAKLWNLVISNI